MSDETPKPEQDVQIRKKDTTEAPETTEQVQPAAEPEATAKAQPVGRTRVAYAEGFEPTTKSATSNGAAKAAETPDTTSGVAPEEEDVTTDDFAAMFDAQGASVPQRKRYNVGDRIKGTIEHIDTSYIYVDMGGRGEGRASRAQFTNSEGELAVSLGDSVDFYVLAIKPDGIALGKHLDDRDSGIFAIEQAMESGLPIQGRVTEKNKGGFEVEVLNTTAFCPRSQIDLYNSDDADQYVGQTYNFRVIDVRDGGRSVVVSRAALMREEAEQRREETMKNLQEGSVLSGIVRSTSEYGAFVDLGGIDGLVHISEMSWGALDKPSDLVKEGDSVDVKILKMETRENGQIRISLSMKQAQKDPWEEVNANFSAGDEVEGTVVRLTHFGAFVELSTGIDGLVHISEMSWKRIGKPSDLVSVGDSVKVKIKDIDVIKRRISLSMREAKADPWDDIETKFGLGQEVEGTVEKVEDFGAFIDLGDGVTALLPRSEMDLSSQNTPQSAYRKGQVIKARVLNVEPERRRMALSTKKSQDEIIASGGSKPQRSNRGGSGGGGGGRGRQDNRGGGRKERAPSVTKSEGTESLGTFADLFKKK